MSDLRPDAAASLRLIQKPEITRVKIKNYRSIASADLPLAGLNILVGRNGSGKSNLIDAIRFVGDSLQTSIDHAVKSRGGMDAVRRRSTGHPHDFSISLQIESQTFKATFAFEIGARPRGGFVVKRESLSVTSADGSKTSYRVREGVVTTKSFEHGPPASQDRLYLVSAAGFPEFRPVYDALVAMGFYNLNPEEMKKVQNPDAGELLRRDGSNVASVLARLAADQPAAMERICEYLRVVVPGIVGVERKPLGPSETLEFRQEVQGAKNPWTFFAANMSDGTLRALGVLVATFQLADKKKTITLAGIEEPETALHPAAAGALMDALREAATRTQIIVTTHNPDILDRIDFNVDKLLAVQASEGITRIGVVDAASLDAIKKHLFTAGELFRMDQLSIDESDLERQQQSAVFDPSEG